jgi:hypothetical protein
MALHNILNLVGDTSPLIDLSSGSGLRGQDGDAAREMKLSMQAHLARRLCLFVIFLASLPLTNPLSLCLTINRSPLQNRCHQCL